MTVWAVDTHVHLTDSVTRARAVFEARNRLVSAGAEQGLECTVGVLLLADTPDQDGVAYLRRAARHDEGAAWAFFEDGAATVCSRTTGEGTLLALSGHQVVTQERLEVLALLVTERPPDGQPLAATIEAVVDLGGVPVIPWGVGKWLGRRGRVVERLLSAASGNGQLAVADNANRPLGWRFPVLLKRAAALGYSVLHGSDPLSLEGEDMRIGAAGVLVEAGDVERPVARLRRALLSADEVTRFGRLASPVEFMQRQIAWRLRKAA